MRWLAWLIVLVLALGAPHVAQAASPEEACTALGANCICAEGLNTSTHDGGQTTFTPGAGSYNMDDSPASKQCYPFPTDPNVEIYCIGQFTPVTAASEAQFLPSGHTLQFVLRRTGSGTCHIMHPRIVEQPGMTYCIRGYSRWAVGQPMPSNNPNDQQQEKILTIAGSDANAQFVNIQISMGEFGAVGEIHTRWDSGIFNTENDFQTLGTIPNDCENNYCRFEACFDYSATGEGRARLRMTRVSPGSGQNTVIKPVGTTLVPGGLNLNGAAGSGLALFAQFYSSTRYNTHFITTRVRPENRSFWPGAACEVEGNCGVAPPPLFTLTINTVGSGTTSGAGSYQSGAIIVMSATPSPGWQFSGWSGTADCTDGMVTITANTTCTATFTQTTQPAPGTPTNLTVTGFVVP